MLVEILEGLAFTSDTIIIDSKATSRLADDRNDDLGGNYANQPVHRSQSQDLIGFGCLFGNAAGNWARIYTRRSTAALHRRRFSTLCVRNSECAAYYRLHAQATS